MCFCYKESLSYQEEQIYSNIKLSYLQASLLYALNILNALNMHNLKTRPQLFQLGIINKGFGLYLALLLISHWQKKDYIMP